MKAWIYRRGNCWYVGWRDAGNKRRGKSCGPGEQGHSIAKDLREKLHAQLVMTQALGLPTKASAVDKVILKLPGIGLLPQKDKGEKCFVYFVEAIGLGKIKIGTTSNRPELRIQMLQNSCPVPLQVLAIVEGGVQIEAEVHEAFCQSRSHGEWFFATKALRDYIASVIASSETKTG